MNSGVIVRAVKNASRWETSTVGLYVSRIHSHPHANVSWPSLSVSSKCVLGIFPFEGFSSTTGRSMSRTAPSANSLPWTAGTRVPWPSGSITPGRAAPTITSPTFILKKSLWVILLRKAFCSWLGNGVVGKKGVAAFRRKWWELREVVHCLCQKFNKEDGS